MATTPARLGSNRLKTNADTVTSAKANMANATKGHTIDRESGDDASSSSSILSLNLSLRIFI
jgi:hypothetical protein